uniref:Uncharacterized protein n=1 Tax=Cajanus cajan TaxID=3821 RepID=A0A151S7X4_CAJCA|nr:hypothetical protein KK1_027269 [Cajanus cajan]
MEDQVSSKHTTNAAAYVDTSKAERAVWLMKCPPLVSRSLRAPPSRPVAKVVVSIDPLNSNDDDSPPQFTMELAGTEAGHIPKCYVMDMSKDFIPMSVFSDTPQDINRSLNDKESIIKHLSAANDELGAVGDKKFRKWEDEKRGFVLALQGANEKVEKQMTCSRS